MKKLMGILLAASMVFSLAACGSTADTAASSAAGTTATAEGSSNNQAPDVKVGDRVLFGKYSGQTVKVDGQEYLVMREEDIMGVLE